jgi:hypothetical protein
MSVTVSTDTGIHPTVQATRLQTLAYALTDSPIGQLVSSTTSENSSETSTRSFDALRDHRVPRGGGEELGGG